MKIPFDIKFRPQIESGEYKVETNDHRPVRIICWNKNTGGLDRIVALVAGGSGQEKTLHYTEEGLCVASGGNKNKDLFIITPEPELSEFEKKFQKIISDWQGDGSPFEDNMSYLLHKDAAELLAIARKELSEQIVDHTKEAYENGKAEVLKDLPRWRVTDKPIYGGMYIIRKKYDGLVEHSVSMIVQEGDEYIIIDNLEKLPGLNE